MVKEFIITEGDIDRELDLLLEYEPVDRYRKLMRFYKSKSGNPNEKTIALKRLQDLKAKNHPELAKYKFPEPPKPLITTDPIAAIAQAEMTPEKKKSGNYEMIVVGDKAYDRDALKAAIKVAERKAENLPIALRKDQQAKVKSQLGYPIAAIKKKIKDEEEDKTSQTLTPDQKEIITQAEVTPEKKKSGNYEMIVIGDKTYDRDALKVAIIDVEKKAENLPIAVRKAQQTSLAIIKKKIEDEEEEDGKPLEADVDIHDISKTAKGYVSVVKNFKWTGGDTAETVKKMDLSANAGNFMEMTFVGQILDAVIKAGNSLVVEQNNLESFYAKHVDPALKASIKDLTSKLITMSDSAPDTDATKKLFDEISKQLKDKKEVLEKSPKLTKKFNKVKKEYLELMYAQFEKGFEKEPESEKETLQLTEEKLLEVTIDFSEIKRKNQHLDESFLVMFGGWVKWLLGKMFSGGSIPGTVKGSRSEVESFARAMASERGHIETAKRYGLDHPATYKSKARLSSATSGFEKTTGIKWPFE